MKNMQLLTAEQHEKYHKVTNEKYPCEHITTSYKIKCGVFFGSGMYGTFNCFVWTAEYLREARKIERAINKHGHDYACKKYADYEQEVGMSINLTEGKPKIFKEKTTHKYRIVCDKHVKATEIN